MSWFEQHYRVKFHGNGEVGASGLSNGLALALVGVVMSLVFWASGDARIVPALLLWSALVLVVVPLNRLGLPDAAKVYLLAYYDLSLLLFCALVGPDSAVHLGGGLVATF